MTVSVFYNGEQYELPESMRFLCEYQDSSMKTFDGKWTYILTLSHLKIVDVLSGYDSCWKYKIFVGTIPTKHNTIIIIYGEYYEWSSLRPYLYDSFHHIEVPESEMIDLLDIGNNSCAILLKGEVIVIGITPEFKEYIEDEIDDDGEYDEPYLSILRIEFSRKITDFPFDRSSIDGRPSFDKSITLRDEKNDDGGCEIVLCFTCVCSYSNEIHSETTNEITISFSNEQIRISYEMNTTTYERNVLDGTEYNDFPTIRTNEKNDSFYREITYDLFPEEDD